MTQEDNIVSYGLIKKDELLTEYKITEIELSMIEFHVIAAQYIIAAEQEYIQNFDYKSFFINPKTNAIMITYFKKDSSNQNIEFLNVPSSVWKYKHESYLKNNQTCH